MKVNRWKVALCRGWCAVVCIRGLVAAQDKEASSDAQRAMSAHYEDLKWQAIVPELGSDSPQISDILRVDPTTKATQLLIRTPKENARSDALAQRERDAHDDSGERCLRARRQTRQAGAGRIQLHTSKNGAPGVDFGRVGTFLLLWMGHGDLNWAKNPAGKSDLGQDPPAK